MWIEKSLTLQDVKKLIFEHYYGKHSCEDTRYGMESREMFITKIRDCYNTVGTVVFSINGSPPKGVAVFIPNVSGKQFLSGQLYLLARGKTKKYYVCIDFGEKT